MGVLEEDLPDPRVQGPLAGGLDLPGHLLLKGLVVVHGTPLGLRPVGDPAGTLDIGADKYLQSTALLFFFSSLSGISIA